VTLALRNESGAKGRLGYSLAKLFSKLSIRRADAGTRGDPFATQVTQNHERTKGYSAACTRLVLICLCGPVKWWSITVIHCSLLGSGLRDGGTTKHAESTEGEVRMGRGGFSQRRKVAKEDGACRLDHERLELHERRAIGVGRLIAS
jgi:hypothetical protein